MEEELEDPKIPEPQRLFLKLFGWSVYVDVSSESIADLCTLGQQFCTF